MDCGDCTLSGGEGFEYYLLDFDGAGWAWVVSRGGVFCNRSFRIVSELFFLGEIKNGEEFDASLWDEECGFGGADGSCCRCDHDEFECCFSPE
jgi:hypothetical protein